MTAHQNAPKARSLARGTVLSGRFRVQRLIAEGGVGQVYEVEHLHTRRNGALKLLRTSPAPSSEAVERLLREASAAGRIDSPHIVDTFDAGQLESGEPYVFMELLLGQTLHEVIHRRGRLPVSDAVELTLQAAEALVAAHAAGIVHRDIKPANLFLLKGAAIFVKILDFGVSKFGDAKLKTLTKDGRPLGTFCYMPPEQMMGAKGVDERADVYALAVVLYQCLVAAPPFLASDVPELARAMLENDYMPLRRVRDDVPRELEGAIARALRAERRERHASMREFHAELAALCPGLGLLRRPSLLELAAERSAGQHRNPDPIWAQTLYGEPSPVATVSPVSSRRAPKP